MTEQKEKLPLFPAGTTINGKGNLVIGGCEVAALAVEFGTPLYAFDEASLHNKPAEYIKEFRSRYPDTTVNYSCKAFINKTVLQLFRDEGLGLDVVSGGEIGYARAAGFPANRIDFPGNNKSADELSLALDTGVRHIVVDNFHELEMLGQIASRKKIRPDILLRISPGVDPHTHHYITTGNIDSKFGIPMMLAEKAVSLAVSMAEVNITGLHFHIGSQLTEIDPYLQSVEFIMNFAADMRKKYNFELKELSVGGGFAVQYTLDAPAPPVSFYAEAITSKIKEMCDKLDMSLPRLIIEPGRSMVARAGVAIYTAGVVKEIPGIRTYVSVDGGMADNIRPALYQARQDAVVANRMNHKSNTKVTIAGKFCESGDVLITDITLPPVASGDIISVAGCGAYCIPEAMNYNASFRPAIVTLKDGKARLIRRRETLDDLTRCDV